MPGRDRTGPLGQGPMAGRGMGFRGRGDAAGRGPGGGGGRGRGWRWRNVFHATGLTGSQRAAMTEAPVETAQAGSAAPVDSQRELAMLKQQADGLATALDEIRKRMDEIQAQQVTPEAVAGPSDG